MTEKRFLKQKKENVRMVCMREKSYCQYCQSNQDGFCISENKLVSGLYDGWYKRKKSKERRKLKENKEVFNFNKCNQIINELHDSDFTELSANDIVLLNHLKEVMINWKHIDIELI